VYKHEPTPIFQPPYHKLTESDLAFGIHDASYTLVDSGVDKTANDVETCWQAKEFSTSLGPMYRSVLFLFVPTIQGRSRAEPLACLCVQAECSLTPFPCRF
jgi:hypothetical protein